MVRLIVIGAQAPITGVPTKAVPTAELGVTGMRFLGIPTAVPETADDMLCPRPRFGVADVSESDPILHQHPRSIALACSLAILTGWTSN